MLCKLYNIQGTHLFIVIVQLILILYFQKMLDFFLLPKCHYRNTILNNLIRRLIMTY